MPEDPPPLTREEALRYEAENYLRRVQRKLREFDGRKERLKEIAHEREQGAAHEAQSYLEELLERQRLRESMKERGAEEKKVQEEALRRQADAYRQRLRKYLRPDQLEPSAPGDGDQAN